MPRRGNVPKRDVLPDPIYGSKVVTKLVNQIMLDGKKGIAQGIVYDAFAKMQEKTGQEAMEVFKKSGVTMWECRNCGHVVVGLEAPVVCPVCKHPQAYFEVRKENY